MKKTIENMVSTYNYKLITKNKLNYLKKQSIYNIGNFTEIV